MAFKPVGIDPTTNLFPSPVMDALSGLFSPAINVPAVAGTYQLSDIQSITVNSSGQITAISSSSGTVTGTVALVDSGIVDQSVVG